MLKVFNGNSTLKKIVKNVKSNYELFFYDEYLLYVSDGNEKKYVYKDINNVIENDTNFYLISGVDIINLPKRDVDYKLISFVRRTFDEIDNKIGEDVGIKEVGKFHDSKVMKKVLLILFVLSIVSVLLGLITWWGVISYLNVPDIMAIKYRWVALLYIPIPVISVVIGVIYNKKGHDCLKNIIAGVIAFFCILGFGVTAFRLENMALEIQKEMSYLSFYKDIMKIPAIPKTGKLYYSNDAECTLNNGYENKCDQLIAYFEDYEKFEKYLFKSDYWILDKDKVEGFETFYDETDLKTYYSLYNSTTKDYNKVPKDSWVYKLYIMEYIPELAFLSIIEIDYEVK